MALSAGQVSLSVKPDTSKFGRDLSSGIVGQSGVFDGMGRKIGGLVLGGFAAVGIGRAIGNIFSTGFDEAKDASAGIAQLTAGIKSTGNAANVSVDGMEALASSIQGMSGQTDDSIVKAEQLLLTFTNIKNVGPDKIFDQATQAAADMAAKMGGDASSNAILLGKALNDPIKGLTSLSRAGVQFTQSQKDSITAMVSSGDTIGAQKIILGELQTQFGGAAKAAGESLPGQLARGQRAFEDISQTVVEKILPVITPVIEKITDSIKKSTPTLQAWATGFAQVAAWVAANLPLVLSLAGVVVGLVAAFKVYSVVMAGVRLATALWTAAQVVLNVVMAANPIGIIILAIVALVAAIVWVATQTTFFQDAWKVMTDIIATGWNWLWGTVLKPVFDAIGAVFGWLYNTIIVPIVTGIMIYVGLWAAVFTWLWVNVISPVIGFIVTGWNLLGRAIGLVWSSFIQPALNAVGTAFNWIWANVISPVANFIGNAIRTVGNTIHDVFSGIAGFIGGAFQAVLGVVRGPINGLIGLINGAIDGLNSLHVTIPDWVPVVGGQSFGVHIPKLPMLAKGGTITDSGSVIVGENGPELLTLPRGATVNPDISAGNSAAAGDRPIYADGVGLIAWIRELANGEARLVWAQGERANATAAGMGWSVHR